MTFAASRARVEIARWRDDCRGIYSRLRVGHPDRPQYLERIVLLNDVLEILDREIKREIDDLHENER